MLLRSTCTATDTAPQRSWGICMASDPHYASHILPSLAKRMHGPVLQFVTTWSSRAQRGQFLPNILLARRAGEAFQGALLIPAIYVGGGSKEVCLAPPNMPPIFARAKPRLTWTLHVCACPLSVHLSACRQFDLPAAQSSRCA